MRQPGPDPAPVHLRHKPSTPLSRTRELIVALPPMQSQVNVARVVRAAGCFGVPKMIVAGQGRIDPKIAREALDFCTIVRHRTLAPVLESLKQDGFRIIGLEQATGSVSIYQFAFPRRAVLVIGHERQGMEEPLLRLLDDVVEIPVYGRPASYNAATSAIIGIYEYCRQFPRG